MLFVGNVAREEADSVGQVMDRYNSLEHTHTMVPVGDVSARHAVRALGDTPPIYPDIRWIHPSGPLRSHAINI